MASVWVRWRMSTAEYREITINDVLGEVTRALDEHPCEARGERHSAKIYLVATKIGGPYVLCRRCCKELGLPC
jgi:hypothetical protein